MFLAVAFVVGCDTTATPTPAATGDGATAPAASQSAVTSPEPNPSGSAPEPTLDPGPGANPNPASSDLIVAALAAGRIDSDTATLYRLYATTADPRLPEEYAAAWREDNVAFAVALDRFAGMSPELQAAVRPFIVRPTDPASIWAGRPAPPPVAADTATGAALAAYHSGPGAPAPGVAASLPCVNNWITRQVSPNIPVVVWAPCGADAGLNKIVNYVAGLWQPMVAHMGDLILDANVAGDDYPDCAECGDGKLDVYVTIASQDRGRQIEISDALGYCVVAAPLVGSAGTEASASYIVLDYVAHASDADLENTVAHELFHAFQHSHNALGIYSGPAGAEESHWFTEASATWSEFHFVPHGREEVPYPKFVEFQRGAVALGDTTGSNAYIEWPWPLFMHQERGAASIANAWGAFEGQTGTLNLQGILNRQVPFATQFRTFAVRLWNRKLLPGDPIPKRFEHLARDPNFPLNPPGSPRLRYDEALQVQGETDAPKRFKVFPEALQITYARFDVDDMVGKIELDFTGITPAERLDVDFLLKIRDKGWEHRPLDEDKKTFCLDEPKDDIETMIVILSNHDLDLEHPFSGDDWTIKSTAGCGDLVGVLTVTRTYLFDESEPGLPKSQASENLTATVSVVMKRDDFGGFEDKRSKFKVARGTTSSRENGDCTAVFSTRSEGKWKFTDRPVGEQWESGISAFVDVASKSFFGIIVAHYPLIVEASSCGGGINFDNAVHDTWACERGVTGTLTENVGADDKITVDCTGEQDQSGTYQVNRTVTTIQGVLTLRDETTR